MSLQQVSQRPEVQVQVVLRQAELARQLLHALLEEHERLPEALDLLGVEPDEAVAFEDSPNGATAAKAAGIYVVGVPNAVTADLGLDDVADVVVESLADLPPDELLAKLARSDRTTA
jgi:beta-phosphoglucomutase-like phosphatase (HAD superfamily)